MGSDFPRASIPEMDAPYTTRRLWSWLKRNAAPIRFDPNADDWGNRDHRPAPAYRVENPAAIEYACNAIFAPYPESVADRGFLNAMAAVVRDDDPNHPNAKAVKPAIIFCHERDQESYSTAVNFHRQFEQAHGVLRQKDGSRRSAMFVWLPKQEPLKKLLENQASGSGLPIRPFGSCLDELELKDLRAPMEDRIGQVIRAGYHKSATYPLVDLAAAEADWRKETEMNLTSNRMAAIHFEVKLAYLGLELARDESERAAVGYTNTSGAIPATATTLYAIDTTLDILVRIGGADGPPSPNTGAAVALAELRDPGFAPVNFGANATLDIQALTDSAFASNGSAIYSIALSTGTTTSLGTVGGGFSLTGLTIAPPATGAGTLSLSTSAATFPANRGPVAITVTRSGGSTGPVTADFATANGTAVAGVDYLPTNGTLSFANGQLSRTIFLQLPSGTPANAPAKTFTLNLNNATGGASLGATTSATVTIPAVSVVPTSFFAVGSTQNARVTVYDSNGGAALFSFRAFEGTFSGEARVAVGDVNGDGFEDVIVGAGPGAGPRIQVFDGRTLTAANQTQIASFNAFDAGFVSGLSVASGDVNGDGFDDIIVGAGAGAGPHVKVFDGRSLITGSTVEIASFFAFDAGFIGGVSVGAGDVNGDGRADVIVGSGVGTTSHVKVFDGRTIASRTELASYFAFDAGFNGGVNTTARDVNRDGFDDVIVGAGPGGTAHVKYFDGRSLITGPRRELASFFASDSTFTGGIYVG